MLPRIYYAAWPSEPFLIALVFFSPICNLLIVARDWNMSGEKFMEKKSKDLRKTYLQAVSLTFLP
jgi:hypothetical protein